MRQKYFGVDGEIRYVPETGYWIGFMGGKVAATRNNRRAVENYLASLKVKSLDVRKSVQPKKVEVSSSIRATLVLQVAEVWKKAGVLFPSMANAVTPKTEFYSRGRTAGKAYYSQHKVTFNEVLAEENKTKFLNTVIHEVAHLVVHKLFPMAKAHGKEFRMVMRKLGGDGERCHSYDTSSVRVVRTKSRYVYKCSCQEHKVTANMHNKAKRGVNLKCRVCSTSVVYTGKVVTFQ